jgi:hypothetical protein
MLLYRGRGAVQRLEESACQGPLVVATARIVFERGRGVRVWIVGRGRGCRCQGRGRCLNMAGEVDVVETMGLLLRNSSRAPVRVRGRSRASSRKPVGGVCDLGRMLQLGVEGTAAHDGLMHAFCN